jgi:hypothetical protein
MNEMTVDIGYAPDWVAEMKKKLLSKDFSDPHVREIFSLPKPGEKSIDIIEFAKVGRQCYLAEVGKKGSDIIFHFFPHGDVLPSSEVAHIPFDEVMGDAFLDIFKFPERLEAAFSEELKSWAVRVIGYADNPAANTLCWNLLDNLDQRMKL